MLITNVHVRVVFLGNARMVQNQPNLATIWKTVSLGASLTQRSTRNYSELRKGQNTLERMGQKKNYCRSNCQLHNTKLGLPSTLNTVFNNAQCLPISYLWPIFPRTRVQNDPWLLGFYSFSNIVWTETLDAFSEGNVSQEYCWQGP